jgi:cyclic beta-1,2-glucan synthetase
MTALRIPLLDRRAGRGRTELLAGPIRGELLGTDQLAEKARTVAGRELVATRPGARRAVPLLTRVAQTRRILDAARARLADAAGRGIDVGPAGDWLLDNFHLVQEHIHEVYETLPRGYYRELPELATGPLAGFPRVYELAIALISHSEARVDLDNLDLFVTAWQTVSPLSIGELWALPAMLRLGLIESVRRMALRALQRMDEIEKADAWALRIETAAEQGAAALGEALDAFVEAPPRLTAVFVARLLRQLRLTRVAYPLLVQIEQWIADRSLSADDAASRSTAYMALTQVMMANSLTSLRAIGQLDWRSFVERQSAMEAVLRDDPAAFYARMTFETRDRYRHVVERIARRTGRDEAVVARSAVSLAARHAESTASPDVRAHVGYYLVDDGLAELEAATGYEPRPREAMHRWVLRHPNVVLVAGIVIGTLAALAAVLWLGGAAARAAWPLVVVLALVPASDIAIAAVNQLVTAFLPPRVLARLDLRGGDGVPAEFRTAVVVPTLFDSVDAVREAFDHLEVQFLANRRAHLHYAVLSDFTDAPTETCATDAAIVAAAIERVRELNERYAPGTADTFFVLHRPRRWNPQQNVWMGWERKRGKLAEFNQFVRGGAGSAFSTVAGAVEVLRAVRYVITLDSDTVLPPDAAADLIGALAHPLNRAVYDEARGRVIRGYGILQPRVGVSLPSAHRSHFAAIYSGQPGIDPYTTAVSDVYQDLYGEGSFTGKGIYDVDAFEQATHGRFPENTLLSHDLIEGSYARAGLDTATSVYDDYPRRYLTFTRRKHRWIRGDWQLLGWLTPRVAGPDGPEPNRLPLLSRWKILDNLRRSTVEIGQFLFLLAGWTVLPGSALRWTLLGLAAIAAPWIVSLLLAALRPPFDKSWRAYYAAVGRDTATSVKQVALAIVFLPHQAWISADAIVRTLWRLFVTKRRLLEWQTASTAERALAAGAGSSWRALGPAVSVAAAGALLAALHAAGGDVYALPWQFVLSVGTLTALWMASPIVAHALSMPAVPRQHELTPAQRDDALRLALLHWRYFDHFITAETQWLAPDNYQYDPTPVLARRTSPTNIGLQLLAIVSARDLGFIGTAEMTRRLELAFRSLERMRRFRGHFFNWYDLDDLSVLEPAYISTVDSGNLAGHLIAVRQACLQADADDLREDRLMHALRAALAIAAERVRTLAAFVAAEEAATAAAGRTAAAQLRRARAAIARAAAADATPADVSDALTAARDALLEAGVEPHVLHLAEEWIAWALERVAQHAAGESAAGADVRARLDAIAERAASYVAETDFRFLFDEQRELFVIGYRYDTHTRDRSYYDLFASEARLASFVAIAKNEVPVEHWFRLGRALTHAAGRPALVSWSGSMFEYLMPALVMRTFPFTLLDQTFRGVVHRHAAYGAERNVPWGASESAYNLRDRHLTYQYRAFGVPDLALKRGLGRDLVIAPYASALAVMVDAPRALDNLAELKKLGALGPYGFRDAVDFTRPEPGQSFALVGNYMAHHVGMSLVALTNALAAQVWHERFHADPLVRSVELLLHERIPRRLVFHAVQQARADEALPDPEIESPAVREFDRPDTARPHVGLLGRQPYTLMISHCGSGYSRYRDKAVTRWRADGTTDATGQFCYVRDVTRGAVWSVAHQPVCAPADRYSALLATDRVTFHRTDGGIETRTEIAVVPEDAAEVRSVTVTNRTRETREIELTSYGEIVLGPPDADRAHAAFANLFVETEWHEWCTAITATRRPRSATEPSLWCVHVVDVDGARVGPVSCETDRARFVGRGRSTRSPLALDADGPLSGTTGAVLDPIFALRTRVRLRPGESASVAFTTLIATTRELAFELADRYHDPHTAQRALDLAWTSQQLELRELGLTPADAALYQELAGLLLYPHPELRAPQEELLRSCGSQPLLWASGISGDWPIVLATIDGVDGLPTLRQLFAAHRYWRRRGMTVDLVVVNGQPASYLQQLHERIMEAMFASSDTGVDVAGGVFVRRLDGLDAETLLMLRATARLDIVCDGRSLGHLLEPLAEQPPAHAGAAASRAPSRPRVVEQGQGADSIAARRRHSHAASVAPSPPTPGRPAVDAAGALRRGAATRAAPADALLFDNGFGGVNAAGEYELRVRADHLPPAPWVNVVANARGGFVVSERGAGPTWADSSYFFRLTPWHNDPVSDPISDVLYLRDEATGERWSATPAPLGGDADFTVRHGVGASVFEAEQHGIATRLTLAMAEDEPVRLSRLHVTNRGAAPRRIELTAYVEWTLGTLREHTRHQVRTEFDAGLGAILARNCFVPEYAGHVAFCALGEPVTGHTADRLEFLGRNGSTADPAALRAAGLAGTTGIGFDPCAALRCVLELAPGETRELVVLLGAAAHAADARRAIARYREAGAAAKTAARSVERWHDRLSVVHVSTPEPAFDVLLNQWLLYQALGCRMWARTALYQSSGAYGFRDQLQDVLAFVHAEPGIARDHIIRAASRQFVEGDVQHWWHPHTGRGVRTRFSDDLVWLPYVVDRYVTATGDAGVLDEYVPFLSMRALEPHEHEVYELPAVTDEHGSIYEHCLRALRRACTTGAHGLPLIGSGDWNDGMNRVGAEGRGESVWLAWFLITTLRRFAERAAARGDDDAAAELRARADGYVDAVETYGWDGEWYRRAFFDDGTPLGSAASDECRIDSIAQSWSVISGAGRPERQQRAMRAFEEHLVDDDARLIRLLAPPFDRTAHDPGYIRGYLPGVRENGAQYTHAAVWAVLATALRGDGDRAFELFQMLNPLLHSRTPAEVALYKVEPYVVAADVYTAHGHVGRGGWTWYTGAAAWLYQVGLEAILGFRRQGDRLRIEPRVPAAWPEMTIDYRYGTARYTITVREPARIATAAAEVLLDGRRLDAVEIPLVDDGQRHDVLVRAAARPGHAGA